MEVYLKKYFWVVNILVVVVCAFFAAKAANHVIEAMFLSDSAEPTTVTRRSTRQRPTTTTTRSKLGAPLAARNMFCSECQPEEPAPAEPDTEPVDDGTIRPTSLPLELVATNVSRVETVSFATIRNTEKNTVGAYGPGDEIPGAGPVTIVRYKYVDFTNTTGSTPRVERIALGTVAAVKPRSRTTRVEPTPPRGKKDDMQSALDEGIRKVDDSNYEIDRSLVNKILANPAMIRGARIVPSIKDGKPNGFKLYAIRPSSAFSKIGLQNGDTIHAINGFDLTTPDKALEVYTKVREANNLSVTVTRRGKSVTMNYNIH